MCKQANDVPLRMKMILLEKIVVFFISLVQVRQSVCSHFRGGTFAYKPVDRSNPANTTVGFRDQTMQKGLHDVNHPRKFLRSLYPLDLHRVFKQGEIRLKWVFIGSPNAYP